MNNLFSFAILTNDTSSREYLGIGYLSSALKKVPNIEVGVTFYNKDNQKEALDDIVKKNSFAVGMPVLQNNFYQVLALCKEIKKKLPNTYIILGNCEASTYADYIMKNYESVDIIIRGEGELTVVDVCQRLLNHADLHGCEGIVYRKNGCVITNPPRKLIEDLDAMPFPDRSFYGRRTAYYLLGSRGCGGKCTFCDHLSIYKYNANSSLRERSIKNIIDEVEELKKNNPYCYIRFLDATFEEGSGKRLDDLYKELSKRKLDIQFSMRVRAEQITDDLIRQLLLLKEVGLERIFIGMEAYTEYELKLFNKRATLSDNLRAMDLLQKYGLLDDTNGLITRLGLIPFHPYTTFDSLRQIALFLRKYRLINCFEIGNRMYISAATPITKKLINDGLLSQDSNEPIIDHFCYNFKEERISYIFKDYCNAIEELEIYSLPQKLMTNYNIYKDMGKRFDIGPVLKGFHRITDILVEILLYLVDNYENNTMNQLEYRESLDDYQAEMESIRRELHNAQYILATRLYAQNKLGYFI